MAEWIWLGPAPRIVAEGKPYMVNALIRGTTLASRVRIIERTTGQPDRTLSVFLTGADGSARADCLVLAKRLRWRDRSLGFPIGERGRDYGYDGDGVYPLIARPNDELRVHVLVPTRRRLAAIAAGATSLAPVAKLAVDPSKAIETMVELAVPLHDRLERVVQDGPPPDQLYLGRAKEMMERHLQGGLGSALLAIAEAAGQLQVMRDIERQAPGGLTPGAARRFALAKMTTAQRLLDVMQEIEGDVSKLPRGLARDAAGILMQVGGLSSGAEDELVRMGDQGGFVSNMATLREQLNGDIAAALRVTQQQGELADEDVIPGATEDVASVIG